MSQPLMLFHNQGKGRPVGGGQVSYLIRDDFTDTNGVLLTNHVIKPYNVPATAWTQTDRAGTPTWDIQSNRLHYGTVENANGFVTVDPGIASCVFQVDIVIDTATGPGRTSAGLVARVSDANSYWLARIDTFSQDFILYDRNAGAATARATRAVTFTNGQIRTMRAILDGNRIIVFLDGTARLEYNSTFLNTLTAHGVVQTLSEARNVNYDNFKLWSLEWVNTTPSYMVQIGNFDGTPVIPCGGEGDSDRYIREIGNVLYEPGEVSAKYKTWYTGYNAGATTDEKLHYAYSEDGITWTKSASNPVIADRAEDPYVVRVGDTYYLFAEDKAGGATDIKRWESADGETWVNGQVVLEPSAATWEDNDVSSPVVWIEGGAWYMLYECRGTVQSGIGLATSVDGATWVKEAAPVMLNTAVSWATSDIVPDDIVKIGTTYHMFFHAYDGVYWRSGIATSTNLTVWTEHGSNPFSSRYSMSCNQAQVFNDGQYTFLYWENDTDGIKRGFPIRPRL